MQPAKAASQNAPQAAAQTGAAPTTAARPIPKLTPAQWLLIVNVVSAPLILIMLWAAKVIRPGSLGEGRGVKAHPWWVWLFAALVVWMSLQAGAGSVAGVTKIVGPDQRSLRFSGATQLAGYSLALISALAMCRLLSTSGGAGAGLTFRAKDIPLGFGCLLLAYPILDLISRGSVFAAEKLQGKAPDQLGHSSLVQMVHGKGDPWVWAVGASAIVFAPIVEEVIYRGFLQSAVLRLSGKAWPSIFITSAIFAAAHYAAVPYHVLGILFFLGVAMGLAFERTKSLGVSIMMHVGFNAANVALAFWLGA